jgi:hypothetical protein
MRFVRWNPRVAAAGRLAAVPLGVLGLTAAVPGTAANLAAAPVLGGFTPVPPNSDVSQRPGNEAENTICCQPHQPAERGGHGLRGWPHERGAVPGGFV